MNFIYVLFEQKRLVCQTPEWQVMFCLGTKAVENEDYEMLTKNNDYSW